MTSPNRDLPANAQNLQDLLDREAIRDCLHRYCRGIDRMDEACLRSVYWPDGTDRHGPYQGSAQGFVEWALDKLKAGPRGVHLLSNILIDLRGEKSPMSKLTSKQVVYIRRLLAQGIPAHTLAVVAGVSHRMIGKIRDGTAWPTVTSRKKVTR